MIDISMQLLYDLSVIPEKGHGRLHSLYEAATQKLGLRGVDYCTIRDLVRLAGRNDLSLHLLLIAMFSSLNEGSVCLAMDHESLKNRLDPVLDGNADAAIKDLLSHIGKYDGLIIVKDSSPPQLFNNPRDEYKPLVLVREGGLQYLYFHKYFTAEQALKQRLSAVIHRKDPIVKDPDSIYPIIDSVLHEKPAQVHGVTAELNDMQKLGIALPLLNNFTLISGGPGTGKTFLVLALVRVLARVGVPVERIKIAAPTGRAARKLTDAIQRGIGSLPDRDAPYDGLALLQGTTIHRLLEYSPSRNDFIRNSHNRIRADIIIIDEASMIDLVLLGKLFEAVGEGTSVVMLGDRNQLPSVEAGAVLAHLIPGDENEPGALSDRVVHLRESYRSVPGILAIAQAVNDQKLDAIKGIPVMNAAGDFPAEGIWRVEPGRGGAHYYHELHRMLDSWLGRFIGKKDGAFRSLVSQASTLDISETSVDARDCVQEILSHLDEMRILTPYRSGISGTAGINAYIAGRVGPIFDPAGSGKLFSGAPVIITKNDYDHDLFNGDVGVLLKSNDFRYYGVFPVLEGFRAFPVESLPPFELSYAITVHKSQGSEYGNVLFIIPDGASPNLLTKEILYTGITRAKKLIVIYASVSTLSQAIQNRIERQSGIMDIHSVMGISLSDGIK